MKMAAATQMGNRRILDFEGSNFLRMRLVLATLSGKPIRVKNIRSKATSPGNNKISMHLL
jgi:RNA 3'-terminal phosphate cyclase-like protein